ncbi:hypothetical protein HKCCSP123_05160, partial [Rhodobacterales bacterium HKCCSP123]|nr:hypothetical protein [Rhodobacterales bacterium HKCCSP123]
RAKIRAWVIERMRKDAREKAAEVAAAAPAPTAASGASYWARFDLTKAEAAADESIDEEAVEQEVERILDIVMAIRDPDALEDAYLELQDAGLNPLRLLGEVQREGSEALRYHEQAILDLEARRSSLLRDWRLLRRGMAPPRKR